MIFVGFLNTIKKLLSRTPIADQNTAAPASERNSQQAPDRLLNNYETVPIPPLSGDTVRAGTRCVIPAEERNQDLDNLSLEQEIAEGNKRQRENPTGKSGLQYTAPDNRLDLEENSGQNRWRQKNTVKSAPGRANQPTGDRIKPEDDVTGFINFEPRDITR